LRSNNLDPDAVSRTRLHEVRAKISAIQTELRNQQKGLVPANKIAPLLQSLLKNHANVQLQALHTLKAEALSPANPAAVAAASQAASAEAGADPLANEKAMKDKIAAGQPAASSPAATVANTLGLASASASASATASASASAASAEVATAPPTAQVYKHAVEIVLTGNYLDLLAVLQEMEKLPWQLYWAKASLRTEQYPQSTLTLHVFTLSLDQIWLDL
jgi:MSHA biogenesis protein MshJ